MATFPQESLGQLPDPPSVVRASWRVLGECASIAARPDTSLPPLSPDLRGSGNAPMPFPMLSCQPLYRNFLCAATPSCVHSTSFSCTVSSMPISRNDLPYAAGYKKRIKQAIKRAGGVAEFARSIDTDYQLVQGWRDKASVPGLDKWPALEARGFKMMWYLFGIHEVPDQKSIDREALLNVVRELRQKMDELEAICADLAPPNTEKHKTERKLKAVKTGS